MGKKHTLTKINVYLIFCRFLASGDQPSSIALNYRVGKSTLLKIVTETCDILWRVLGPEYLPAPTTTDLKRVATEFWDRWNFPNCIGAIDGKHITITAPMNTGSEYFNYKKTFSVFLLAACDANYCFTYVDIGCVGSISDGGVLRNSNFGQNILNCTIPSPDPHPLPHCQDNIPLPYCFVGDEAFPLRKNLMRPYGKSAVTGNHRRRIFNYRLSRARRIIENAFGILASRWRIFHKTITASHENVVNYVKGAIILHNFIMKTKDLGASSVHTSYIPDMGQTDQEIDEWIQLAQGNHLLPLNLNAARNYIEDASIIREHLTNFFSGEGAVAWQEHSVANGN